MRISKKITIREILGDVRRHLIKLADEHGQIPNGVRVDLCTIVGKATSWQAKENQLNGGVDILLKGHFAGKALVADKDGKFTEVRGGQCYLPGSAAEMVSAAFDKDTQGVEFAYKISLVSDDSSAVGYTYAVDSLIEPQQDDPLSRLQARLGAPTPAPALPAAAAGTAPVAAQASAPVGKSEPAAEPVVKKGEQTTAGAKSAVQTESKQDAKKAGSRK